MGNKKYNKGRMGVAINADTIVVVGKPETTWKTQGLIKG
jgi:hypothetical protein